MAENPTPKSKIAKLKREIEQLGQKVLECTTDRPAYQPRFASAQDLKTERPSGEKRKDLTARQMDALREQVAAVQVKRQVELAAFQQKKTKLSSTLKTAKATLISLQTQVTEARKRQESEQSKSELQNRMKAARLRREAQLQEREKDQIAQKQTTVQLHFTAAEARCKECEEGCKMTWEELRAWVALHEEYVAEREEVDEMIADFCREMPQRDVADLISALRSQRTASHLEEKQSALRQRLEFIESQLSAATKDCFIVSSSRQELLSHLSELSDPLLDRSLRSVEIRLVEEWDDAGLLDRMVLTLNAAAGFDIDEQILKTQVEIVEQRLAALEKENSLDSLDLGERILELQDEADVRTSDARMSIDIRESRLRHQAEDLAKKQVNRVAAISQWRKEALGLLKTKEITTNAPVADDVVLDEVRTQLRNHPRKNALERLLIELIEVLKAREERFQTVDYSNTHESLCKATSNLHRLYERKTMLQLERIRARSDLKQSALAVRHQRRAEVNTAHEQFAIAELLVTRVTRWEALAEDATAHIKALLAVYRESEGDAEAQRRKRDAVSKELAQTRAMLRASHAKLEVLFSSAGEAGERTETEAKAAVTEATEAIVKTKRSVEETEAELALLESEWSRLAETLTREESKLHEELQTLVAGQQTVQSSRLMQESLDATNRPDTHTSRERRCTVMGEVLREEAKLGNMRSSSELQGTTRSRSLLRLSGQRLPSRSPINSREHEDLMDLLDLDDDLDQLLETHYEEPPTRSLPEGLAQADREFFERVMPLIDGTELFKKFSQSTSLRQRAFDPLLVNEVPPEACGYGLRTFRLSRDLQEVEVKQGLKSSVESTIPLDQIHMPLIPQSTMAILKTQKKLIKRKPGTKAYIENLTKRYKEMKESGFVNPNSPVFEEKCRDCSMYPFSIVIKQSGRLEVVARSYYAFKTWVNGLNALIKRRDELEELSARLRVSRRWA